MSSRAVVAVTARDRAQGWAAQVDYRLQMPIDQLGSLLTIKTANQMSSWTSRFVKFAVGRVPGCWESQLEPTCEVCEKSIITSDLSRLIAARAAG